MTLQHERDEYMYAMVTRICAYKRYFFFFLLFLSLFTVKATKASKNHSFTDATPGDLMGEEGDSGAEVMGGGGGLDRGDTIAVVKGGCCCDCGETPLRAPPPPPPLSTRFIELATTLAPEEPETAGC